MGQYVRTGSPQRGLVTIDWMLASVAAIVVLLFVGSMIRTTNEHDPIRGVGGLRILAEGDELLAFQDFGFDAEGWSPDDTTNRLAGLGPVLGPFTGETAQRTFVVPDGLTNVDVAMDLHLFGDWSAPLRVAVDEAEYLLLRRPDDSGDQAEVATTAIGRHRVSVTASEMTVVAQELALPGTDVSFTSYVVRMNLQVPDGEFTLRIGAMDAPEPGSGAVWALDNVTVIAISNGDTGGT